MEEIKISHAPISQSHSVTSTSAILTELIRSKENGNILGIWSNVFRNIVCLTAVDDIIDVEIADDKLVLLKRIDLQGVCLNNNRIYLSEINKIISFNATYNEYLKQNLYNSSDDSTIKIRQREQLITTDDLKLIVIRNINSGNKIWVRQASGEARSCYIADFNPYTETVMLSCELSSEESDEIHLREIEEIEFEFHYDYKSFSSRVFRITPEVCLLQSR